MNSMLQPNTSLPTIVLIGYYGYGPSQEAIDASQRLGLNTVLFTSSKKHLEDIKKNCDVHVLSTSELSDIQVLRERIRHLQAQSREILTIHSFIEPFVHTASVLSQEFCSRTERDTISPEAVLKMHNKILTRKSLEGTLFNPYYDVYEGTEPLLHFIKRNQTHLPLVIKAPVSYGSRDVLLAENTEQFISLLSRFKKKHKAQPILVEKYIDGPQYLIEVVVNNNEIHIVAVVEQEITKNKRFIVTGYCLYAEVPLFFYRELARTVKTIVRTIGMKFGTCHLEMRRKNNEWKLIEINPRIAGGAMNNMIKHAFGINLVEEELKLFLGQKPDLTKKQRNFVFTQYITVPTKGILCLR